MYTRRQPLRVRSGKNVRRSFRTSFSRMHEEVKAMSNIAYLIQDESRNEAPAVYSFSSVKSQKTN